MLGLLIQLIIVCIILAVCWWIINRIPVPAPFAWIVQVIFALVCLIILISLLTGYWSIPIGLHYRQ